MCMSVCAWVNAYICMQHFVYLWLHELGGKPRNTLHGVVNRGHVRLKVGGWDLDRCCKKDRKKIWSNLLNCSIPIAKWRHPINMHICIIHTHINMNMHYICTRICNICVQWLCMCVYKARVESTSTYLQRCPW